MFLKKLVLGLCILTSGTLQAGQMGPEIMPASIVSEHDAWMIAGHGLYLQPANGSGAQLKLSKPGTHQTGDLGAEPNWGWGFNLEIGYQNPVGNDIKLTWSHFREAVTDFTQDLSANNIYILQSYFTDFGTYKNLNISNGRFNINPAWDQVNLEFAKQLYLGFQDKMRVHAGINYSRVANAGNYQFSYAFTDLLNNSENNQVNNTFSAEYNGFGPRLGADLSHMMSNGYIVYGELAASALAGMTKATRTYGNTVTITGTTTPYDGLAFISRPRVVPELDAKLGVKFEYSRPSGHLIADIGWLWANYFGALTCNEQNFGIQGLIVGLKWKANI